MFPLSLPYDAASPLNILCLGAHSDDVAICLSPYEAAREAHALLIVTDWKEYRELDLARLHELMEVPVIVDGRNLLNPETARSAGFEYVDMGRSSRAKQWLAAVGSARNGQ